MRYLILLFLGLNAMSLALAGCGDDPGFSGLPYAYSIDATPDGLESGVPDVIIDASVEER